MNTIFDLDPALCIQLLNAYNLQFNIPHSIQDKTVEKIEPPEKCKHTIVAKPQKFIYPYKIYRLFLDTFFVEEDHNLFFNFDALDAFKFVNSVEKDASTGNIEIYLEENPNFVLTPIKYLIERFESFGSQSAKEWAEAVESVTSIYEKTFAKICLATKTSHNAKTKFDKVKEKREINKIMSTGSCYSVRMKFTPKGPAIESLKFSGQMIKLLRYDKDHICSNILKEGIPMIMPQFDPNRSKYLRDKLKSFEASWHAKQGQSFECHLLDANGNLIPVYEETKYFNWKSQDEAYFEVVKMFRPKTGRNGKRRLLETDTNIKGLNPEFTMDLDKNKKELSYFFKTNYNMSHSHFETEDRVCKYRRIETEENS